MNVYSCSFDLKNDAKALMFAKALETWMTHLKDTGAINDWRLLRRKLNLSAALHRDFLLEIEVDDMAQLDKAFSTLGHHDEDVAAMYRAVHDLIGDADFGLYRPYPDPERAERLALL